MKQNLTTLVQAAVGGFVGLWLVDVITSNLTGHRILHQAGTTGQVCTSCVASTTTPGSFDCMTCAAAGTVGAPQYGCTQCAAGATPGTFTCTGCEGYTCTTCIPGADGNSFTCTGCMDALTAAATGADPCAAVTTPCIFDAGVGGCVRTGNSTCTCSGCTIPSSSTSSCSKSDCIYDTTHKDCLCRGTTNKCSGCSKPTTPQPKCLSGDPNCPTSKPKPTPAKPPVTGTGSARVGAGATGSAGVTVTKPVKVCPPLVKC